MPSGAIHVHCDGEKDDSRWLTIVRADEGNVTLKLQDMTHPGMRSSLTSVECHANVLRDLERDGFVQIADEAGFCQLRTFENDVIEVCFRGRDDDQQTCCEISRGEFETHLERIAPKTAHATQ